MSLALETVESADPVAVSRRVALVVPDTRPSVCTRAERYVMTFPHLIVREVILFQVVVGALAVAALLFDAPLEEIANAHETPNPAKAPWYFLGLQELLHYFPPIVAGVLMPTLVIIALVVIPYARVNLSAGPFWAGGQRQRAIVLGAVSGGFALFFALFGCWPIVVPTIVTVGLMFAARGGSGGDRLRRALARVTLPEWIMSWFVAVAVILTVIGTWFRGPGWSFVWPWQSF